MALGTYLFTALSAIKNILVGLFVAVWGLVGLIILKESVGINYFDTLRPIILYVYVPAHALVITIIEWSTYLRNKGLYEE